MPFGYLMGVVIVAVATLAALAPLRRPRPLANLSLRFGLLLNEVPFLGAYALVLSTLLAFSQGDIDTPGAWAMVGLAVATIAGLAVVAWRGLRAGSVVEQALAEALGADWRAAIRPGLATQLRRHLPLGRILLRPLFTRRGDVERVANLRYGDAGRRNLLDLYRHRAHRPGAPVLIYLHGGGYYQGRKNSQALPLLYRLASQGWLCISANYRLRPAAQHPDHLIDAKKVIAWVRTHGREYGADPRTLFLAGSSAGGHMAALAALTQGDPALQPGFEDADTSITAAICMNGWLGSYYGQGAASSPLAHVREDAPPFFIAHGDQDSIAPVEGARRLTGALRSVSVNPVVYAELPHAQHAFDLFHSLRFETIVGAIEAFAAWILSREKSRTPPETDSVGKRLSSKGALIPLNTN